MPSFYKIKCKVIFIFYVFVMEIEKTIMWTNAEITCPVSINKLIADLTKLKIEWYKNIIWFWEWYNNKKSESYLIIRLEEKK